MLITPQKKQKGNQRREESVANTNKSFADSSLYRQRNTKGASKKYTIVHATRVTLT